MLSTFTSFAHKLADKSGEVLTHYYRSFGDVEIKEDLSPVTVADREAETVLRTMIEAAYPEHGIIGEEYGNIRQTSEYVWVLDPIDGTVSYTIGRPIFGTLIALMHHNSPVVGVIDQPITKDRWVAAQGQGCMLNGKEIHTRSCSSMAEAVLCSTGPNYFTPSEQKKFEAVAAHIKSPKQLVYGGDCYNYGLLACGAVDVVMEAGLQLHDFAALKVVVEEAGGIITDWSGKPLHAGSDGTVLACGDKTLHKHILTML